MLNDRGRSNRCGDQRVDRRPLRRRRRRGLRTMAEAVLDDAMMAAMRAKVGVELRIEHSTNNREVTDVDPEVRRRDRRHEPALARRGPRDGERLRRSRRARLVGDLLLLRPPVRLARLGLVPLGQRRAVPPPDPAGRRARPRRCVYEGFRRATGHRASPSHGHRPLPEHATRTSAASSSPRSAGTSSTSSARWPRRPPSTGRSRSRQVPHLWSPRLSWRRSRTRSSASDPAVPTRAGGTTSRSANRSTSW